MRIRGWEVLREGYRIPFLRPPPLFAEPIPMSSYAPTSIKGAALEEVTLALIAKGAVELAPLPSPGFYSRLFVVWKTSGSWRPVSSQSLRGRVALPAGDHPVCSSVCPTGGLDGLHRPDGVSSTSNPFCLGPPWRCFATTSPRSPICARRGAPGLLLSTASRRRSSVGRSHFRFGWLHSSFRDPQCSSGLSLPSSSTPQH